jgi:hypothetical protein
MISTIYFLLYIIYNILDKHDPVYNLNIHYNSQYRYTDEPKKNIEQGEAKVK